MQFILVYIFVYKNLELVSFLYQGEHRNTDIIFTGDVSFAGFIYYMKKIGNCTYNESFSKVVSLFHTDFVVVNLESPFGNAENPPPMLKKGKKVHMMAELESVTGLK